MSTKYQAKKKFLVQHCLPSRPALDRAFIATASFFGRELERVKPLIKRVKLPLLWFALRLCASTSSAVSRSFSQRNCGRHVSRKIPLLERGSLKGLWPMVILSQVPPMDWILDAWFTARQTEASAVVIVVLVRQDKLKIWETWIYTKMC